MLEVADDGDVAREDTGCGVLYGFSETLPLISRSWPKRMKLLKKFGKTKRPPWPQDSRISSNFLRIYKMMKKRRTTKRAGKIKFRFIGIL